MFDVHCKYCGEPWDNDFFHDCVKDKHFDSYQKAVKAFTSYGVVSESIQNALLKW